MSASNQLLKVLLLENSGDDALLIQRDLKGVATVDVAINGRMFREMLKETWDVILCDLSLPDISGEEAIRLAKATHPKTGVIIVTGSVTPHQADAACEFGASRFLMKESYGVPGLAKAIKQVHATALLENQTMRDQRHEILGTLAAGLAHDMRNILGSVIMGIGVLRDRVDAVHWPILDAMNAAANKGADMVSQMTTFAKGANGGAFKSVTAEYLLGEVGRFMRYSTAALNIRLQVRTEVGTAQVICDPVQINTILLNMAMNAKEAMPHGGDLFLEARNSVLHEPPFVGSYVCFAVRDTGPGIPVEARDKIFDAYFTTKGSKGTGLGLAFVRPILEAHKGTVKMETGPTGTTFYVFLPVTGQSREVPREVFDGRGAKVVLVDDEEMFRSTVAMLLENANYTVLSACNGPEALAFFRAHERIDLLLSDLQMPLMCGLELSRLLHEQGFDVPTVFVTGSEGAPAPPPAHLLHKPFTRESLLGTIQSVLASHADKVGQTAPSQSASPNTSGA